MTSLEASSEVVLAAGWTATEVTGLVEASSGEFAAGVNVALKVGLETGNEVAQEPVAVWPVPATATSVHPAIAAPFAVKLSVPAGAVPTALEVTIPTRSTV